MITTQHVEYLLPIRLPSNVLIATEDQPSRRFPSGTPVRIELQHEDNYLITPTCGDSAGQWWHWAHVDDLLIEKDVMS